MDAVRTMTVGAVDLGEKPAVLSAIAKYHLTERMRSVVNDAMDVHGGKGICLGPNNYLGRAYQLAPVAITVEGANILTRTLIIFGQGAIRCHPFVLREIAAAEDGDAERGLAAFDEAFWGHVGFVAGNAVRSLVLGLSGGRVARTPGGPGVSRHLQSLTRCAAAFALTADVAMLTLGGTLKRREKISGRLGDVLSLLYLASAAIKRWRDQGDCADDRPLLDWVVADSVVRIEAALDGVFANLPSRSAAWILRRLVFPLGRRAAPPDDALGHAVAATITSPGETRDRLTAGFYCPPRESDAIGRLELAFAATIEVEPVQAKLREAQRSGAIVAESEEQAALAAVETGIITMREHELLRRQRALVRAVVAVDDFSMRFGHEQADWQPWTRSAAGAGG